MLNKTKSINKTWLSQVNIRNVTEADLPALEWEGEFKHFRQVYANAYKRSQRGLSVLWVLELPGKGIIGQVFVQLTCDRQELADGIERAYFYAFRVRPEYRSTGLGSLLLETLEKDLFWRGFQRVTLNVAKENTRAQEFYERHGYQITAHEPGIWSYPDHNGEWHQVVEPAWRMEKQLISPR